MDNICVIYYTGELYKDLARVAYNSFVKFHKNEVECFLIDGAKINSQEYHSQLASIGPGRMKYLIAYRIAMERKAKKVIILGADTITCSRLDEFLDSKEDILCTLDYPYQFNSCGARSPDTQTHLNADVVCFNNLEALSQTIQASMHHSVYHEQGGLNEVIWKNKNFSYKIVDYPYLQSTCVYNTRAKGNFTAISSTRPNVFARYTTLFHVKDGKLYTGLHENNPNIDKQIKVWHYCEGLGANPTENAKKLIEWWKEKGLNQETKDFFTNECDAGDFFK